MKLNAIRMRFASVSRLDLASMPVTATLDRASTNSDRTRYSSSQLAVGLNWASRNPAVHRLACSGSSIVEPRTMSMKLEIVRRGPN